MKTVLKQTLALILSFVLAASVLLLVAIFGIALIGASQKPSVPKDSILVIRLDEPLTERGGSPSLQGMLQGEKRLALPAHEAAAALRAAADDKRIKGVLLHGGVSGSLSSLSALREALGTVRAAKKPVLAYYGSGDEKVLWLASAADELWMEPLGILILDGWAIEIPYFGETLAKYGVEVQVTRVGKYKSAVEPFQLGRMSAENREQLEALLADFEALVVGDIASSTGIAAERLRGWMSTRGCFSAAEAVEVGLAKRAAPFGELLERLREITGTKATKPVPQVDLLTYAAAVREKAGKGAGVQVLVAEGEIVDGGSKQAIGGDDLARRLRAAREDQDVKAVVMRVDSPGGSATASDVIRRELLALKAAGKPVIVSMASLAASGGYWISANADRIVAQPETITGSIGVFGMLPNVQQLAEEHGLRAEQVRTSPLTGWESVWRKKDERQVALVQALVDQIYERFLDLVVEGRGLSRDKVHEIAQGRVWSGRKALELGLIDELGGLERAIALAKEKAGLDEDAPVRYEREEPEWFEALLQGVLEDEPERLARAVRPAAAALDPVSAAAAFVERLREIGGPRGIVARLPFDLVIR